MRLIRWTRYSQPTSSRNFHHECQPLIKPCAICLPNSPQMWTLPEKGDIPNGLHPLVGHAHVQQIPKVSRSTTRKEPSALTLPDLDLVVVLRAGNSTPPSSPRHPLPLAPRLRQGASVGASGNACPGCCPLATTAPAVDSRRKYCDCRSNRRPAVVFGNLCIALGPDAAPLSRVRSGVTPRDVHV